MTKLTTVDDYVTSLPEPLRQVAQKVRPMIDTVLPQASAIWHGHPVWSLGGAPGKSPVCLLKAHPSYLTFGFWRGRQIHDPSGRMDVRGDMAHIRLRTTKDIDPALFANWLHQARELELSMLAKAT